MLEASVNVQYCAVGLLTHCKPLNRLERWRSLMRTVSHVELGAVEQARQQVPSQATFGQRRVAMRAVVLHCMELSCHATHHDTENANVCEYPKLAVAQIAQVSEFPLGT